ncbi:MAG: alpha-L-arabinofuranosidase [Thermomicrobiales bacterium]|jgi:alpha-N-arabinofuranosidase|nr:alpha-L-arabinofuranosidase [Thermomicrobiales bacterium]
MTDATLVVRADDPIGIISPRLYGHFAEHLGRCCYDGLWVGGDCTDLPHEAGFRRDLLDALRAMPVPLLRWPGGCYADHYHWRDGIGPPAERPRRLGMSCGLQVEDDNGLGTHEFLRLCALLGAEPYLTGNVGTGTPQELCDWVEYCNSALDTTLARERVANGAPAPFGVRLWGVGNENWGCGGNYDAASYAREYRRYVTMLRHVDSSAELVVCGYDDAWNQELLETLGKHTSLVDHLSIHSYWIHGGPEIAFDDRQYDTLLAEARATETFVARTAALLDELPGGRRIGVALDEWGVWHPEARPWGPGEVTRRTSTTYEQANTLRDALAAAVALEGFHRQCRVLSMANLAQIVNVLQAPVMTDGTCIWRTPTYHVFRLHAPHIGATALPVEVTAGPSLSDGTSAISATASRDDQGLAITVINQDRHRAAEVRILGSEGSGAASGLILTADHPSAGNDAEAPDRVVPVPLVVDRDGTAGWCVTMPPHSVATILVPS